MTSMIFFQKLAVIYSKDDNWQWADSSLIFGFSNFNAWLTPPAFNAGRTKTMAPE